MKRVDVAIIGAGKLGQFIAGQMRAQNKETLLIALPGNPEDYFRNLVHTIAGSPSIQNSPSLDGSVVTAKNVPRFLNDRVLSVDGDEIEAKHYVIVSGCGMRVPSEFQNRPYLTPLNILNAPSSTPIATVVGAGPVGVGTAAILAARGTAVKLLCHQPRILLKEDADIAAGVQSWLENRGVRIEFNAAPSAGDNVILATGLLPNTAEMDLPKAGVYVAPDGRIVVDEEMRTPNKRIHAAGAVTGPVFNLAYEDFQAELVAENIFAPFFSRRKLAAEAVPSVIPMGPPIARVGLTEEEAKSERRGIISVTCSFEESRIKLVGKKKTTELLGAHIFGPGADTAIMFFDLLMRAGIALRDVNETNHYPAPGPSVMAREAVKSWLTAAGE